MEVRVEEILATLTTLPGVYQMLDGERQILYVGKAKNLKKRVSSYFSSSVKGAKTAALVAKIKDIEITVTQSETEALLLEQTLIKKLKPPFNILLRDDKSYPYIYLSTQQPYPRLCYHRGGKQREGRYFGPYPSGHAVRESLNLLQKLFKVRQCDDTFFRNRSRPCLQYQIKRCSAPCVDKVSDEEYQAAVRYTELLLDGKNEQVLENLMSKMDSAAAELEYERAAEYRDQIRALRHVQETQYVDGLEGSADVLGVAIEGGISVVNVVFVREGRVIGSRNYPVKLGRYSGDLGSADELEHDAEDEVNQKVNQSEVNQRDAHHDIIHHDVKVAESAILETFLPQFYIGVGAEGAMSDSGGGDSGGSDRAAVELGREIPDRIVVDHPVEGAELLSQWLSNRVGRKVKFDSQVRTSKAAWLKMAHLNAAKYIESHLSSKRSIESRYAELQSAFSLPEPVARMECFDISHTSGQNTVASCVVFDHNGPLKSHYRRFNIHDITPGDDYAAMEQVLTRRYLKIKQGEELLPDLLIIDGGKGQLSMAHRVLQEMQLDQVTLIGVAKGPNRRLGMEEIFQVDWKTGDMRLISLDGYPLALHLIQHIRDEAHRFAVVGHRAKREHAAKRSGLESIPGVGPKRRQQLLKHFGGLREVKRASAQDLSKVSGISKQMAEIIYNHLHQ